MDGGKAMNEKIKILYEDNHILVVIKPIGVLSQADRSNTEDMLTLLKEYIKKKYQKPGNVYLGLVHRLDKEVGGIMVFAKTSKAASRLSEQVRNHKIEKTYWAIVKGKLPKEGRLEDYLERKEYRSIISTKEKGKLAKLHYWVQKEMNANTLVEIKLETGRHHQIRVQFSNHGNPLLGDKKYGEKGKYPLALYAVALSFYHPITGELVKFETLPPKMGYWNLVDKSYS